MRSIKQTDSSKTEATLILCGSSGERANKDAEEKMREKKERERQKKRKRRNEERAAKKAKLDISF